MPEPSSRSASYEYTEPESPEQKPTLPLPAPDVPTPSFYLPETPSTNIPFLSALARRKQRRRKKKLVITCLDLDSAAAAHADAGAEVRRERDLRRRQDAIIKWCETFGAVRRLERKSDGSLHVYWREWEVADMVSARCVRI